MDLEATILRYATDFKEIHHTEDDVRFFTSAQQFLNVMGLKYPLVLFIPDALSFIDRTSDNIIQVDGTEIFILKSVEKQDVSGEKDAYKSCREIAKQFIAQLIEDSNRRMGDEKWIPHFNPRQCVVKNVGPIHSKDNCFGVILTVFPGDAARLAVDASLWD